PTPHHRQPRRRAGTQQLQVPRRRGRLGRHPRLGRRRRHREAVLATAVARPGHPLHDKERTRMTMTPEQAAWFQGTFRRLVENVDKALQGKPEVVSLVIAAMLAEGHVLLEDAPGTGKTSLAKALAATVQGTSSR